MRRSTTLLTVAAIALASWPQLTAAQRATGQRAVYDRDLAPRNGNSPSERQFEQRCLIRKADGHRICHTRAQWEEIARRIQPL